MHVQHAQQQAAGVYGGCVCSTQWRQGVQQGTHAYHGRLGEWWAAAQRMPRRARRPGPGLQAPPMYGGGGVHVYDVQQGKRYAAAGSSAARARRAYGTCQCMRAQRQGTRMMCGGRQQRSASRAMSAHWHACTAAGHAYDGRRVWRRLAAQRTPRRTGMCCARVPAWLYGKRQGACDARGVRGGQAHVYGVQRGERKLPAQRTWVGRRTGVGRVAGNKLGMRQVVGRQIAVHGYEWCNARAAVHRGTPRNACNVAGPAYVRSGGAHAYGVRQGEQRLSAQRKYTACAAAAAVPELVRNGAVQHCLREAWLVMASTGEQQIAHYWGACSPLSVWVAKTLVAVFSRRVSR
ncbi:hypothetical protein GGX14DRAFT_401497 [Mycena pura]|uniref:Uncharacterized protein n=1 Tax=Mycena pura TaxID=153505 RepID=A0AAD6V3Y0_9AGAR|nr:hypothetical protein GGX14DRAFT_401497 [Mycena pura]